MALTLDPETLRDDVQIEETNLDKAFREQASLFAHYATLYFNAARATGRAKVLLETKEAVVAKEIRDRAIAASEKITEKAIEQELARHKEIIHHKLAFSEAEALEDLAKNALEAFKQRKDMLVQLGANAREEYRGELTMKTAEASRAAKHADFAEQVKTRMNGGN